ncbi:uncharacterized protein LOC108665023 [Hyalella azteca]|uniref:Uncharacterized protein LOC108665023 n=1 Tax=Hyalella azteca TaxID=294128 RepID=A0A8B7N079_HYAAZ|nr:uncharacterized protein LOC108665023 [Hyalella azteca]XP_018007226.1 uncharacterized protein LOC108665023 [Hyalella azteca]XP_018007227.1 uncharacterized protein LOC108665023 [Hyalella azteca]
MYLTALQSELAAVSKKLLGVLGTPLHTLATRTLTSFYSDVQQKLENRTLSLALAPMVMGIDTDDKTYVNKDGFNLDVLKYLQEQEMWYKNEVLNPKLKASSFGDYYCALMFMPSRYFESREKLDYLYSHVWHGDSSFDPNEPVETIEKIPFEEALKLLTVTLSCNMEYYLANWDEMEKDLGRKLDSFNPEDESFTKGLERELFYNQVIKIIGESEDDDKATFSVMLKDFRALFLEGNDNFATARRGDNYLLFHHVTS